VVDVTLCLAESFTKTLIVNVPVTFGVQDRDAVSWDEQPPGSPVYA
jgi:hypothetical protein